jgi:hypothetical protein
VIDEVRIAEPGQHERDPPPGAVLALWEAAEPTEVAEELERRRLRLRQGAAGVDDRPPQVGPGDRRLLFFGVSPFRRSSGSTSPARRVLARSVDLDLPAR